MSIRIAFENASGAVEIVQPNPQSRREGEDESAWLKRVCDKSIPAARTSRALLSADALPRSGFRDAWRLRGGKIVVDMPAARELHRDSLRAQRKPRLAELDIQMSRAFRDPAAQSEAEQKRQALRDIADHRRIEQAQTPEALTALTLDELLRG